MDKKQQTEKVIRYNKAKLSIDDGSNQRRESNTTSYLAHKRDSFVPSVGNGNHLSVNGNHKHQSLHVPQDSAEDPVIELVENYSNDNKDRDYSNGNAGTEGGGTPTPTPTNDNDDRENNVIVPLENDNGFPDT
eukprot:CAMPEP_0201594616 /NCGR_PEP_ID=MMETSP0190_2-20130828/191879_1 /ASSEMBLY_ACC=CAM_ASM_000263 /TAXON_ID=37353 /ORGANISM="Rosalina sp." /LENGTH=132 /DNA_ID=CAMNT_0048054301 /DNA_START=1078 /DNA_END=1476 /DNA_ORIENTATION=+